MSFKILYVTATGSEAESLKRISGMIPAPGCFKYGDIEISPIITGVGSMATAWALKQWLSVNEKPDLAINAGIAGSFRDELEPGTVVMPVSDCFADSGVEDGNNFLTLGEAGLSDLNEHPFKGGLLNSDSRYSMRMKGHIEPVRAITVNTATGSEETRNRLFQKFNPDIETMEGATFFYICAREYIPFLAIRSISNMVGPRDKTKWNIPLALDNLSRKLNEVILTLD
jgi:futalosine hydrolase